MLTDYSEVLNVKTPEDAQARYAKLQKEILKEMHDREQAALEEKKINESLEKILGEVTKDALEDIFADFHK